MLQNYFHKASIIIVTHNGLHENTMPCLESVFKTAACADYELIIVDNNSNDDTQNYLQQLSSHNPKIKLVLNKTNRGFSGGNNDGIRVSSGDYLVLLNNDTIVTVGWLERLLSPLIEDKAIGMAGPVSNAVGNEQLIYTEGKTPEEIVKEGLIWCSMSNGDRFESDMLSFFCIAIRRDVIETIGLLDEDYGLGYFEDDDYCVRVKRAGYKMICAEDAFIYHGGAKSFNRMRKTTHALLKRNRKLLEAKFNVKYSPIHPRDRHLDLIASYIERVGMEGLTTELNYKINNRLRLLEQIKPKGLIKRFFLKKHINQLKDLLQSYLKPATACQSR